MAVPQKGLIYGTRWVANSFPPTNRGVTVLARPIAEPWHNGGLFGENHVEGVDNTGNVTEKSQHNIEREVHPDLWHVKKVNPNKMVHLTEKSVELPVRAIQYSSRSGENVLDLFGGSGSALIGCEQMGRRAFLMELDPLYCDVIVQRFEDFSGIKPERVIADALAVN
jgi:DNA modification methylase